MSGGGSSRIALRRQAALAEGGAEYRAKRAELLRVAGEVFKEKGYNPATLNDVAFRFGTDRASLYYYVGSKEELFHECISGVLDANLAQGYEISATSASPREKLTDLVTVVLTSYEEHYPYLYVYIQEDMRRISSDNAEWARRMSEQTRQLERLFLTLIAEGVRDGSFRSDLSPPLVANSLFGMLNWTHRWYVPGKKVTIAELADVVLAILFDGVVASPGLR